MFEEEEIMFNKPLEQVTEENLQALIKSQIESEKAERRTVEYKQTLPAGNDDSKKEFLADVSSFANASGGYLLLGIEEQAGIPTGMIGIELDNVDAQKLRLEEIIRNGIEPRLPHIDIQPVPLASKPNNYVLILHIQKSWLLPHRVKFKDHGHFYSRNSGGKYRLDTTELRTAFELSGSIADRIQNFRAERLRRITDCYELPAILDEHSPKLILHMIPFNAFSPEVSLDVKSLNAYPIWEMLKPPVFWDLEPSTSMRFNIDGIARILHSVHWRTTLPAGYTQVFRNGIVEAVDMSILGVNTDQKVFPVETCELRLLQAVKRYIELLQFLGVEPPVAIMISFLGVEGYKVQHEVFHTPITFLSEAIDRTNLIIPGTVLNTFDRDNDHIAEIMRPILDTIWNALNYGFSPSYDESGKYKSFF